MSSNSINIGFDAKRAFRNKTGLGNYSRVLISGLTKSFPDNQYFLFTPKVDDGILFPEAFQLPNTKIITPNSKALSSFWRSFQLPSVMKASGVEVFHGLSNELPLSAKPKGIKYVVTIHDLIFMRFPELYAPIDRKIYTYKTIDACKKADVIIAISEQTKRDLIAFLKVPAEKITVVYQNINPMFSTETNLHKIEKVRQKYQLPQRFILQVGTLEKRKNALLTLKALSLLPKDIAVVFVGRKTSYQGELDAFVSDKGLQNRVQFLSNVPSEDLVSVYHAAEVFVYPSIFEGLGIPVLEAIKSGLPVIAATGSCLEEVGGPNGLYVAPDDAKQMAAYIQRLMQDKTFKRDLKMAAEAYTARFSTHQFVSDTMAVYQSLA